MSDQVKEDEKPPINCKVVLIGKSGVGKTSIITRYKTNIFKGNSMSTQGANFISKKVYMEEEKETIEFEIWDTAGTRKISFYGKIIL